VTAVRADLRDGHHQVEVPAELVDLPHVPRNEGGAFFVSEVGVGNGFTLSAPEVSTVIPGMKDPGEVDMNVAYSDGQPFPAELLGQLAEHNWPRNYYK